MEVMREVKGFKEAHICDETLVLTLEIPEDGIINAVEGRRKKWAAAIADIREDQVIIDWT